MADQVRPVSSRMTRHFADVLARERRVLNCSAQELSDLCAREQNVHVSRSVIAKIESGYRSYVTLDEFLAITAVLGIDQAIFLNDRPKRSLNLTARRPMGIAYTEDAPPWAGQLEAVISRLSVRYKLTPRESEMFALLTEGISNKEISYRLHISPATVAHRVTDVLAKLNLASRRGIIKVITSEVFGYSSH